LKVFPLKFKTSPRKVGTDIDELVGIVAHHPRRVKTFEVSGKYVGETPLASMMIGRDFALALAGKMIAP
jgi:hypothetical protein